MEEITCWQLIKMYQEGKLKVKDKVILKDWQRFKKPPWKTGELYIKNSFGDFRLVFDYYDKNCAGLNFDWAIIHNCKFYVVGDEQCLKLKIM